jgi:hypothetical protein
MQMLERAGVPVMTDGKRQPDQSNPDGYYEWELIKRLPNDPHLIAEARGRAVKVVSALLPFLPKKHRYRIVFLRRDLAEIIRSQNRLRQRLTGAFGEDPETTRKQLQEHLDQTYELLTRAPNVEWIEIQFEKLLEKSDAEIARLGQFCGADDSRIPGMKSVVKNSSPIHGAGVAPIIDNSDKQRHVVDI